MKKLLLSLLLLCTVLMSAQAATYYVTTTGSDANAGTTWGTSFRTIQKALAAATVGDEIWVAEGMYYPDEIDATNSDIQTSTFQLKTGVAVYGGFAGGEILLSERDIFTNVTILSGDLLQNDGVGFTNNGDNAYHVVTGSGTDMTARIDGFTITGGNATIAVNENNKGAGMFIKAGSPCISNCTFSGNSAIQDGGGIWAQNSASIISNCSFIGNRASYGGGVYRNGTSTLTLINCIISGNSAGVNGGGIFNISSGGATALINGTVSGNAAANEGGGIFNIGQMVTITNTIVWNNQDGSGLGTAAASISGIGTTTITYSLIQNITTNDANNNKDGITNAANSNYPDFVTPVNPATAPTTAGNLRLQITSPVINMGNNAAIPIDTKDVDDDGNTAEPTPDRDLNNRISDDPNIVNDIVDMGAYEAAIPCPDLTAPAPAAFVVNSTCDLTCTPSGGFITFPDSGCPSGSTFQFSADNGMNWSTTPPDYDQTTAVTVLTRCNCDSDPTVSSPSSSVTTNPDNCAIGSETFGYTGDVQDYTIPAGVTSITIAAIGADGGNGAGFGGIGGAGGTVTATFAVNPGDLIRTIVGAVGNPTFTSASGGGGTAVVNCGNPANCATGTLLVVAGGGGGSNLGNGGGGATNIAGSGNGGAGAGDAGGGGGLNSAGGDGPTAVGSGGGQANLSMYSSGGAGSGVGGAGFGGGGGATGFAGGGGGYTGGNAGDLEPGFGGSNFVGIGATNITNSSGATGGGAQVNGVVTISIDCPSAFICPTLAASSTTTYAICSGDNTSDISITSTANDLDVKLVYFTTQQIGTAMYTGGTMIGATTTPTGGASPYTAAFDNLTFPANNTAAPITYYVYAILDVADADLTDASCRPFVAFQVTVNPLPTGIFTISDATICEGEAPFLQFQATAGTPNFIITFGGGNINPGTTSSTVGNGNPFWTLNTDWYNTGVNTYTITQIEDANGCITTLNEQLTLTVNPLPTGIFTISDAEICEGEAPFLQFQATAGTPNFTITFGGGNINPGTTSSTVGNGNPFWTLNTDWYNTGVNTYTITQIEDANGCITTLNEQLTLTVSPAPTGTIQGDTVCQGEDAFLFFTGTGTAPFFIVIDGLNSNQEIMAGAGNGNPIWTFVGGQSLSIGANTFNLLSVRDNNGCTITGDPIDNAVIVINGVDAGVIASDQTICSGDDPAAFTSTTDGSGSGTITYRWESSTTSCATGFTTIGGATSATYDSPSLTVTTYFRRITISTFENVACEDTSNCVTVTVNQINPGTIGGSQTVCITKDPTPFTSITPATGSGTITYQWESSTISCDTGFTPVDGATAETFDPAQGQFQVTTYFRRRATSTLNGVACSAVSNCVTLTVLNVDCGQFPWNGN